LPIQEGVEQVIREDLSFNVLWQLLEQTQVCFGGDSDVCVVVPAVFKVSVNLFFHVLLYGLVVVEPHEKSVKLA
jgi:hypothetical protein